MTMKTPTLPKNELGEKKKRRSRFTRAPASALPPFRPTERDIAIVSAVYAYRALTTDHIATLLFTPTTLKRCDERLGKLYDHKYLERTVQPPSGLEMNTTVVHWIDERGITALATYRGL